MGTPPRRRPRHRPSRCRRPLGLGLWRAVFVGLTGVWAGLASAPAAAEGGPRRVVSINLCTDQLALLLAAPGQLVSVSRWSARPAASNLPEAAAALPLNDGLAEEVWLLKPDLVLAGTFNDPATLTLLGRLGVRVETFPPALSLAEVAAQIRRAGALLGRAEAGEALAAGFERDLAAARARAAGLPRIGAAWRHANDFTAGAGTLASEVMEAARLENAAAAMGLSGMARLPLEALVMLQPFVLRAESLSGARVGRAYETDDHPALAALAAAGGARIEERRQACATPFVAMAVEALVEARRPDLAPRAAAE